MNSIISGATLLEIQSFRLPISATMYLRSYSLATNKTVVYVCICFIHMMNSVKISSELAATEFSKIIKKPGGYSFDHSSVNKKTIESLIIIDIF
jgi:hypothetical protein